MSPALSGYLKLLTQAHHDLAVGWASRVPASPVARFSAHPCHPLGRTIDTAGSPSLPFSNDTEHQHELRGSHSPRSDCGREDAPLGQRSGPACLPNTHSRRWKAAFVGECQVRMSLRVSTTRGGILMLPPHVGAPGRRVRELRSLHPTATGRRADGIEQRDLFLRKYTLSRQKHTLTEGEGPPRGSRKGVSQHA